MTSARWVLVGYGGGDDHVNAALRHGWAHHKGDPNFRCVIVNWLDTERWDVDCVDGRGMRSELVEYMDTRGGPNPSIYTMYDAWRRPGPAQRNSLLRLNDSTPLQEVDDPRVRLHIGGSHLAFSRDLPDILGFLEL